MEKAQRCRHNRECRVQCDSKSRAIGREGEGRGQRVLAVCGAMRSSKNVTDVAPKAAELPPKKPTSVLAVYGQSEPSPEYHGGYPTSLFRKAAVTVGWAEINELL